MRPRTGWHGYILWVWVNLEHGIRQEECVAGQVGGAGLSNLVKIVIKLLSPPRESESLLFLLRSFGILPPLPSSLLLPLLPPLKGYRCLLFVLIRHWCLLLTGSTRQRVGRPSQDLCITISLPPLYHLYRVQPSHSGSGPPGTGVPPKIFD